MTWRQPPKRRDRPETCQRKVQYATWDDAERAALVVWREKPRERDVNLGTPYRCTHCGCYHFGH